MEPGDPAVTSMGFRYQPERVVLWAIQWAGTDRSTETTPTECDG